MALDEVIDSLYPPLSQRTPAPPWYMVAAYAVIVTPHLAGSDGAKQIARAISFPLILTLFLGLPCLSFGSPQADYNTAPIMFQFLSFYLETIVFPPREGLRCVAYRNDSGKDHGRIQGVGVTDCTSLWSRLRWALRLQTTARGVGWNWRVKNVPESDDGHLSRWRFVAQRLGLTAWYLVCKTLTLCLVGCVQAWQQGQRGGVAAKGADVALGWLVAAWVYNGLQSTYHGLAAASVAAGCFDTADWPPLFGRFRDAWSVRQMWSLSWHQVLRRLNQQPSIRMARWLGLRAGTLGSRYFQLYCGFFLTALLHEWSIFNSHRRDHGEMWFFMVQALAITVEDAVQAGWLRCGGVRAGTKLAGRLWTFLWFSYTLPVLARSLLHAGLLDVDLPMGAMDVGAEWARKVWT